MPSGSASPSTCHPAPPAPAAPERALTRAELAQWEAMLDYWDGFLAFLVKDLAAGASPDMRTELLDLLLTARREVTAVLARGPEPGVDPVRPLFLRLWERLRDIMRRAGGKGGDDARALRYVVFLAAGDALTAIEAAAPAAGLDFSADGLRRLARTLAPSYAGDPLDYSTRAGPPAPGAVPVPGPRRPPPRRIRRKPPAAPRSWLRAVARAPVGDADEADEWRYLAERLDRWVPTTRRAFATYREIVEPPPDARRRALLRRGSRGRAFRAALPATSSRPSPGRRAAGASSSATRAGIVPIQSSTGDVGMMQINVRVWRGFFNPVKLRWNAGYNAGAGTEILWQLLGRYGVREARERLSDAARSSYSAYHGGPRRYRRYRSPDASAGDAAHRPGVLGEVPGGERRASRGPRPLHARPALLTLASGPAKRRTRPRLADSGRASPAAASTRPRV